MNLKTVSFRPYQILLLIVLSSLACQTTSLSLANEKQGFALARPTERDEVASSRGQSGQIAYIGTDRNIYLIDPNGKNLVQLTDDATISESGLRNYNLITWAPDSKGLAFVQTDASRDGSESTLFLADPANGELTELFQSEEISPFYLHFSPNSQSLAFLSADTQSDSLGLFLIPTMPAEPRVIENGQPVYWAWSPDSAEMFVHIGGRLSGQLAFLNPEAESRDDINLQPTSFQAPAFTPNGEQLIVAIENEGEDNLALINRDGTIERVLATLEPSAAFILSPNGEQVAYITSDLLIGAGAIGELAIVDVAESEGPSTIDTSLVVSFFWSPDGRKIAYLALDPDGRQQAKLAAQEGRDLLLDLYIYDLDSKTTSYLHSFTPTNQFLNVIPYFDQYHLSTTYWSPDSRYLTMPSQTPDSGGSHILIIDTELRTAPTRLIEGVLAFWSWQ